MVSLGLKLADNNDRDDDFVLGKAGQGRGICQENACI